MNTQDNDIDKLFHSKLGNMEIEPTERVWKGITQELDGTKRKRSLVPVFSAAASIALVLTAGIFYLIKPAKNNNQNMANNRVNIKVPQHYINENGSTGTTSLAAIKQTEVTATAESAPAKINYKKAQVPYITSVQKKQVKKLLVTKPQPEQMAADKPIQSGFNENQGALTSKGAELAKASMPVVPDVVLAEVKPEIKEPEAFKTDKTAPSIPQAAEVKPTKLNTKKHGIRSFGDLINTVIAKVDKRQDKVIEFSNTDGDEATITGVNLGFIKVKAEK